MYERYRIEYKDLLEVFRDKRETDLGIAFITGADNERFISYHDLYDKALNLLFALQHRGLEPGDELIFQLSDNFDFVSIFWACILGKIVPVPVTVGNSDEFRLKLFNIRKILKRPHLVTSGREIQKLVTFAEEKELRDTFNFIREKAFLIEDIKKESGEGEIFIPDPSDVALIQFSSGSTGDPKGVVLTHDNLLTNIRAILKRFGRAGKGEDKCLSWMPLTHDMGLILLYLTPLAAGWDQFLMPPGLFIKKPGLWLKKISQHRVTVSASPNFGFNHVLKCFKQEDYRGIDLSSLRLVVDGAEPISIAICREFIHRMTPYGLGKNVILPGYGLAEASVGVSISNPGEKTGIIHLDRDSHKIGEKIKEVDEGANAVSFVDVGCPVDNCSVRITGDRGQVLGEEIIGHIQVKGRNVTAGYYNNEEVTSKILTPDGWLDTGDLGFLKEGRLIVTGREKDVIFVNGRNFYPHDIERIGEKAEGIGFGKIAVSNAYNADNQGDEVLCFVVFRRNLKEFVPLVNALKRHIVKETGVEVDKIIPVKRFSKTTSGKLQRYKLKKSYLDGEYDTVIEEISNLLLVKKESSEAVTPGTEIERVISGICKHVLKRDNLSVTDNFFDLGGTSLNMAQVKGKLEDIFNRDLDDLSLFKYSTIRSLARHLTYLSCGEGPVESKPLGLNKIDERVKRFMPGNIGRTGGEIAVIGISGRFPGAKNIVEFRDNLENGVESISFFSEEELVESGIDTDLIRDPDYVKAKGVLDGIEYFDSSFFGYSPGEADMMDPQARVFHECIWGALEDAAYNPGEYDGLIGVYAGASPNAQWQVAGPAAGLDFVSEQFLALQLNDKDFMTTRISYKLDLRGPSYTMYTACSTSLVAVDLACKSLLGGGCDIALAGGVSLSFPQKAGYMYQEAMLFSRDGHVRAFDRDAGGTLFGDGVGVVVLKRLQEAIADNDHIRAVIKSSAINNDGNRKVGYSAPGFDGQVEVIRTAHLLAGIEAESIGYIETHGTGTKVGDPIEIGALSRAFNTGKRGYCAVGSVKTNVGHLNVAAGAAGLIKTVLALEHRRIPPSLNFKAPNTTINFESGPFYVNTKLKEWENGKDPLRAGVSSFGIGGTNAHVVLEEWAAPTAGKGGPGHDAREYKLLLLSAKTPSALDKMTENLVDYLKDNIGPIESSLLADVAYTLQTGRKAFEFRRSVVCAHVDEAVELLSSNDPGTLYTSYSKEEDRPVVYMFSGQGSQYVNMGLDLYRTEPLFREETDHCFELLKSIMGHDVQHVLYPADKPGEAGEEINRFLYAPPVKFIFEYSIARLLMKWGIKPRAMIGHSVGEYVPACLAGVFSLEDALTLLALRGKLMQEMPEGAMMSVPLSEEELKPLLSVNAGVSLAAVNTPSLCTVSGPVDAIDAFEKQLNEKGLECMPLNVPRAGHSNMMTPILGKFETKVKQLKLNKPQIPYISGLTGTWIKREEAVDPGYWARHLKDTIRFSDGIAELLKEENFIFIQVGPGRGLTSFVDRHPGKKAGHLALNLVRHPKENVSDVHYLFDKIGQLWANGKKIDWAGFYPGEKRRRIPLPTYPFEGRRCRVETGTPGAAKEKLPREPSIGKRPGIADWFYIPSWKPTGLPEPAAGETVDSGWLVFADDFGIGSLLAKHLEQDGQTIVTVKPGQGFGKVRDGEYTIHPGEAHQYVSLLEELKKLPQMPRNIIHLWLITGPGEGIGKIQDLGYYSLLYLARAIGSEGITENIRISIAANNLFQMAGEDHINPAKATVLGPHKVIPREYPNITCRCTDIVLPAKGSKPEAKLIDQLLSEFKAKPAAPAGGIVALRNNQRWVQVFEPVKLAEPGGETPRLREKGVYLITGGRGGIGLVLAEYLAKTAGGRLILVDRSTFPLKEEWDHWLNSHHEGDKISRKIVKLKKIEELGAEILVFSADVADPGQMRDVVDRAQNVFGHVNGVIHCAGVLGDGIVQLKTREMSERVFRPKLEGTVALDDILKDIDLDFFILCSSLSSILGPHGQVSYCAANAFLDAFAHRKVSGDGTYTVSINWDAWKEVGMLAAADADRRLEEVNHPLVHRKILSDPGGEIYAGTFSTDRCWILDEHRLKGRPTVPGTAYLEIARAAFENSNGDGTGKTVEMRDVYFLNPLMVGENEEKEVYTILKKCENGCEFYIMSKTGPGDDSWREHCRGQIAVTGKSPVKRFEIREMEEKCNHREIVKTAELDEFKKKMSAAVDAQFGPRWKDSIKGIKLNTNEGLVELELPEEFVSDIPSYRLHPALLDAAAGFLAIERGGQGISLPFFYKKLKIKENLPRRVFGYAWYSTDNKSSEENSEENITFNISIMDEKGTELVEIEDYTLKRVDSDTHAPVPAAVNVSHPAYSLLAKIDAGKEGMPGRGILPAEGMVVFRRILGQPFPQVAAAAGDLQLLLKRKEYFGAKELSGEPGEFSPSRPLLRRHQLRTSTHYVAPRDETEQKLVETWQDFFGFDKIGLHDNFFELGGDSLKAITLSSIIHKEFKVKIPVTDFFSRPTPGGIAGYLKKTGQTTHLSIEPVEEKEYYPVSSAQERLYILQQMDKSNRAYNELIIVSIKKGLSKERVVEIFEILIKRHESLRTSFHMVAGAPVQRILPFGDTRFSVEYYDLSVDKTVDKAGGKSEVFSSAIHHFVRPFDLSRAPLLRVGLIETKGTENTMMIDMHHIITDATSYSTLAKEFLMLCLGVPLPGLLLRYKDFSQWQTCKKHRESIKRQQDHWLHLYSDELPVLNLPTDFLRPAVQSFEGASINFVLNEKETLHLKNIAGENDATLYMTVFSVFNILLFKLSGQEDIIVGTPVAGRRHAELENIIGMFVNTLPIRNNPSGNKTFREFLKEVKRRALDAFENQEYQFEDLVDKIKVKRETSRNPIFDVMFAMLNTDISEVEINGTTLVFYQHKNKISKFDLALEGVEKGDQLFFTFEYCTKLFKKETVETFTRYFRGLLLSAVEYPDREISELEIISEEEKNRIVYEFNDTNAGYPEDKTIHKLFEEQVEKIPGGIAVFGPAHSLECSHLYISYRELDERSDRSAQALWARGVGPGDIVGLAVERSVEMIIGVLGILKAGGVYLPIAPGYPRERIDFMMKDSNARILLTQQDFCDKPTPAVPPSQCRGVPASRPSDLAYLIYTSGSTGAPKGVMIEHRGIANLKAYFEKNLEISPKDRVLQFAGSSFDASLWEMFMGLLNGASLYIVPGDIILDHNRFEDFLEINAITVATLPPTYLVHLDPGKITGLRKLITAGSETHVDLVNRWKDKAVYINAYGPTETTICATAWRAPKENTPYPSVPIGIPLLNTRIYILDKNNKLQPVGISGEMCIGGVGVARGYLNNPELTNSKFQITNYTPPLSLTPLYHTGDIARWLPDGNIEFLGRSDHQVKIRGFRIELGEIETRLQRHHGVKESIAAVIEDGTGDKHLCAYIVADGKFNESQLKEYLSRYLPGYMIPSYFVPLDRIPLTVNDKIDRKALPNPEIKAGELYTAPANKLEKELVNIWSDVLGIETGVIGVNDNFFDLGGNSIKVIQLNGKLKEMFKKEIPVLAMFKNTTIRSLRQYLGEEKPQECVPGENRFETMDMGKNKLNRLKNKMRRPLKHDGIHGSK